ncbi:OTU domain-containing protein 5-B isoform X2 [Palaemon carinicauda]|uniref:OTU domain-containing protein 5-B isoform X2 n=1 Tax=Palaemon carinicauda TaxID=392227 RepID=UPI0035B5E24E
MTILPKKKPQQASSGGGEGETVEPPNSVPHQHQLPIGSIPNHIQAGEAATRGPLYLASQSPTPCWPPPPPSGTTREEKRPPHTTPSHYEEAHESGPSHSKRRYRASPLRSVRPKHRDHREHRGNTSPPYPSTSSGWNVTSVSHTHPHQHPHTLPMSTSITQTLTPALSAQAGPSQAPEEEDNNHSGYNSGDEYEPWGWNLTAEEWEEKERRFEKKMKKKNLIIKKMREDGACLFRAIADQVYGDQDMHSCVRKHCMDYIARNEDSFAPFVSENFQTYVTRKRRDDCFGNHIELAAMSEMYNRVIEVYCYSVEPINSFQGTLQTDNEPIRVSYHFGTHYNSLVDPFKATIGVGLGLPGYQPGLAEKNLMKEATRQSENVVLEQAMLEDKIRATDFEATSEAIEEQVAHESYLQWLRENEKRSKGQRSPTSPSGSGASDRCSRGRSSPLLQSPQPESSSGSSRSSPRSNDLARLSPRGSMSPRGSSSPRGSTSPRSSMSSHGSSSSRGSSSPRGSTSSSKSSSGQEMDPAIPGSSKDPMPSSSGYSSLSDFELNETASFLNQLPPDMFGLSEYSNAEADILAQVLAASQQEYLDSLKNIKDENYDSSSSS